jgi:2'-5' RNA ligase
VNGEPDTKRNSKRCFVAIPAPPEICQRAAKIQQLLRKNTGLKGIRWLKTEGLHITLKFLGNVPAEDLTYLAQQLSIVSQGCWPTRLRLDRLGVFPNLKRPRVLWWGPDPEAISDELRALHFHVQEALHLLGHEKEDRPFYPHLTLGRMKDEVDTSALADAIEQAASLTEAELLVKRFDLMESRLHPQGAIYETLVELTIEDPDEEELPQKERAN